MKPIRYAIIACAALVAFTCVLLAQTADLAGAWKSRLEALRPQEPMSYFELAEEMADGAKSPSDTALAKHLYSLAGLLDPDRLGRSACLALADMEEKPARKQRLLALAALLETAGGSTNAFASANAARGIPASSSTTAILAVAEALGHYRQGQGPKAQAVLQKPGADELLRRCDRVLPGGYNRFIEDCKAYRGQAKPTLSSGDITRLLQLESALLAGGERSWSSELLMSAGAPLLEVDPARLDETLGLDATKPYYRNGRWTERDKP